MPDRGATIFRDYVIDGDSGSGVHKPDKAAIRSWCAQIEKITFDYQLPRQDSVSEGGQIGFERASDATVAWFFDCYGSTSTPGLRLFNASAVGVQLTNGATSWSSFSDETLKTGLVAIEGGLQKVMTLRAVTGRYIADDPDVSRSFLIAQDVQKVLPEAVKTDAEGKLLLCYDEVIPLLVAAIKELSAEVQALRG